MTEGDLDRVCDIESRSFSVPWKRRTFRGLLPRDDAELWVAEIASPPDRDRGRTGDPARRGRGVGEIGDDAADGEIGDDAGDGEICGADADGGDGEVGDADGDEEERTPAVTPRLVGYLVLWFVTDEGELADLAVDPEYRGRGIGGFLVGRAVERARARGVRSLFLEVRASNERAHSLYRSRGFDVISVRKGYYSKPREDALVMLKSLW